MEHEKIISEDLLGEGQDLTILLTKRKNIHKVLMEKM